MSDKENLNGANEPKASANGADAEAAAETAPDATETTEEGPTEADASNAETADAGGATDKQAADEAQGSETDEAVAESGAPEAESEDDVSAVAAEPEAEADASDAAATEAEAQKAEAAPKPSAPAEPVAETAPEAVSDGAAKEASDAGAAETQTAAGDVKEADTKEADTKADSKKKDGAKPKSRGRPRLQLGDLVVGTQTRGKVVGISKFGAFVDVGAVTDGLVHISELSDKRVKKVEDVVSSGDTVEVWVKDVDTKKNRISLSMRRKPDRPMDSLNRGDVVTGTVTSLTKYGAFIDIGAETEGLVHISEMSSGFVDNPADVVSVGQSVEVRVKDLDKRRERISLSMAGLTDDDGSYSADAGQPTERQPTVVELALRKALGDDDEGGEAGQGPDGGAEQDKSDLADVYARMLAEYRDDDQ